MQIISTSSAILFDRPRLVIDCSNITSPQEGMEGPDEMERVISWVRSFPRRSAVHVLVRGRGDDAKNRRIRATLQGLGCQVTTKTSYATVA